ncbi:MAG: TVP38/TMEM64 family protein [Pseudomonadota bacterium]
MTMIETADETAENAGSPGAVGEAKTQKQGLARWLPLALIALGAGAAIFFLGDYLSFQTLADNRDALLGWRDENLVATIAVFVLAYAVATAFSVPGAVWFTITGGFLFGTWFGTALSVTGATIGAILIFLAARTSLGETLKEKAGSWLTRIEKGFQEGAVSYLLIMRLVPAIPFFVANLAPAFLGVPLRTFAWTTFVGIIPGAAVYSSIGNGVGALIDKGETPDLGIIFSPEVLGPLVGLALLAALPLIIKRFRKP